MYAYGLCDDEEESCSNNSSKNESIKNMNIECGQGDHVICGIRDKLIVMNYNKGDTNIKLTIIGKKLLNYDNVEYIGYVDPEECHLLPSSIFKVKPEFAKNYNIHKKYIGENAVSFTNNNIVKVSLNLNGVYCVHCNEFFSKNQPNTDGGIFICYLCKQNPFR